MSVLKSNFSVLGRHLRTVNGFESAYLSLQAQRVYPNFNLTVRYNRQLDRSIISSALRNLLAKDPLLSSNVFQVGDQIQDDWNNFVIRPVPKIDFEDVVKFTSSKEFGVGELKELGETPVDINIEKPFWRLLVHETPFEQYLSIIFNHTLADPSVGQKFHSSLLEQFHKFDPSSAFVEELFDYETAKDTLPELNPGPTDVIDIVNRDSLNALQSSLTSPVQGYGTEYELARLSKEELAALNKFSNDHGTSLIALLAVVINHSAHKVVTGSGEHEVSSVLLSGSSYYPDIGDVLRYQLVVPNHLAEKSPEDEPTTVKEFVASIEEFSGQLNQEIQTEETNKSYGFTKYIGPELFEDPEQKTEHLQFVEVTDIGELSYSTDSWKFEDAFFSQNLGPYSLVALNTVATSEGLGLVLSVNREKAGSDAGAITQLFLESIRAIVNTSI